MKKKIIIVSLLFSSNVIFSQVGINTPNPQATFEIAAKNTTGTSTTTDGILIPRVDRQRAQSMLTVATSTLIYVNNIATGTATGKAINIDTIGFYNFDGSIWQKFGNSGDTDINVYKDNGTLTSNRVVTTAGNFLRYAGAGIVYGDAGFSSGFGAIGKAASIPGSTLQSGHFDIIKSDGTTRLGYFGLDNTNLTYVAENSASHLFQGANVGIGITTTPATALHVAGSGLFTGAGTANIQGSYITWNDTNLGGIGITGFLNHRGTGSGGFVFAQTNNNTVFNEFMRITGSGNVGIGITTPTNKLHISGTDPLRLQGLQTGNDDIDNLLVVNSTGLVKKVGTGAELLQSLSVPTPAIFRLETMMTDFLNGVGAGGSSTVPMSLIKNKITGLTYNSTTNIISFPPGTYQIIFVYEADFTATACSISSYFIDFPIDGSVTRVHNTAAHKQGIFSNHGSTISYSTSLTTTYNWPVRLGRGQSGDCSGPGLRLKPKSTHMLIFRLGD